VLLLFLAVALVAPTLGAFTMPGAWHALLKKPSWNPPAWIFGPVWTALYIIMAVAAWLVWRRGGWPAQRRPLTFYFVQLALNAAWTPIFFGLKNPGLAFAEILPLLVDIVFAARGFRYASRVAAALLLPYLLGLFRDDPQLHPLAAQFMKLPNRSVILGVAVIGFAATLLAAAELPNIVLIVADDMG
jgi:tryptophan-rich sensory protein